MLYKKNGTPSLDAALFEKPTAEYRGTPFWAWNDKLESNELLWQIEQLKHMGFGGFHIHSRSGMATEYLGKEFMELVKTCNQKAKDEQMLTWLYDEDRWPSGFAGGYVTKNPRHRLKYLLFTVTPLQDTVSAEEGNETGKPYLIACYDVRLNEDGTLGYYAKIDADSPAQGTRWMVYVCTPSPAGRYNGQTYVDTLSKDAIAEFIRITYNAYRDAVGEDFGGSVPAIFTDEPQFHKKQMLPFAHSKQDICLPYTYDFANSFREAYGIELTDHLPELLWDLPQGKPSRIRYLYHDHVCERFTNAFADQCGAWCRENGIALTGHMMQEDTLRSQTGALGEAMRAYRAFEIPGIDMLCDSTHYATAKQCQSAVNQYGREAMLSELYGVTGWSFDFRGHKRQGDWQAALGVTVRVPHLSWVSMKGSAKRDYPASISYQSSWYREYAYIEDHFARLNTALTRGKPCVKVGVIHPIESDWLHCGPEESNAQVRKHLQDQFDCVTKWLLFGTIDFDYISESLLPDQYLPTPKAELTVGKMAYSAIVVPGLETMRASTLRILKEFRARGGKIIFMGDCPRLIDAVESDEARELYAQSIVTPFTSLSLLNALEEERTVLIRREDGYPTDHLIYRMREDGDSRWLFLANGESNRLPKGIPHNVGKSGKQNLRITVKGSYRPTVYETLTGETHVAPYILKNGHTEIYKTMYEQDSLLLYLEPSDSDTDSPALPCRHEVVRTIDFKAPQPYELSEENVLVLDIARYSENGIDFEEPEELLRMDKKLREKLGYPMADGKDIQPWMINEEIPSHYPYLKFSFESEGEFPCRLAYEELCEVILNGESVPVARDGFFCDHRIYTMPMPSLKKGENTLIVKVPFGKRTGLENLFLLGSFGVRIAGCQATVTALPQRLAFGSVTSQGLPFYGANITYRTEFTLEETHDIAISATLYKGALIGVRLDGKEIGHIVFAPYKLPIKNLGAGKHTLELTLFGTRTNTFNALHNCSSDRWIGPPYWYSTDEGWSYEYCLSELGILKSPVIEILE